MTWRNGHDFARSLDAIDRLVALVDRQADVRDAGLDVLQRLAEVLHIEVIVTPRKGSPVSVAEIEAVAEVLVALGRRGLNDDEVAEDVQTAMMTARDEIEEAIYEYEECPWRGDR